MGHGKARIQIFYPCSWLSANTPLAQHLSIQFHMFASLLTLSFLLLMIVCIIMAPYGLSASIPAGVNFSPLILSWLSYLSADTFLQTKRQVTMAIKVGIYVSHAGAMEWGTGKVLEVSKAMATIGFSDGKSRKIAASHYGSLQMSDAASYSPPVKAAPEVKAASAARKTRKKI
jgi:hypothetical protein